jgi:hypothetical protein
MAPTTANDGVNISLPALGLSKQINPQLLLPSTSHPKPKPTPAPTAAPVKVFRQRCDLPLVETRKTFCRAKVWPRLPNRTTMASSLTFLELTLIGFHVGQYNLDFVAGRQLLEVIPVGVVRQGRSSEPNDRHQLHQQTRQTEKQNTFHVTLHTDLSIKAATTSILLAVGFFPGFKYIHLERWKRPAKIHRYEENPVAKP